MAAVCFECSLWEDLRLRALPAVLRAAIPVLAARLEEYGDGALTDSELSVGLLGPNRFGDVVEALIGWGWLARSPEGRLLRLGALAPVSADALRMRKKRSAVQPRPSRSGGDCVSEEASPPSDDTRDPGEAARDER